jgi:hypothetical protein
MSHVSHVFVFQWPAPPSSLSLQVLEKEAQEEETNESIRTLKELVSQWSQEEDTMDPTPPEEDMAMGVKNLTTQMGWCPMQNAWVTS